MSVLGKLELSGISPIELMRFNADILEELRRREILATSNAPLGDYTEWLFRQAFGWVPAGNSAKDADATGADGKRYQIKGRRLHSLNKSRQLGALRRLDEGGFDVLGAALFNPDFTIMRAALIPLAVVQRRAAKVQATNSWKFMLVDAVWNEDGVQDVTPQMEAVQPL